MVEDNKNPTEGHSPLKRPPHIYEGNCPDKDQPEAFDSECARCQVDRMETSLAERDAEIERLRAALRFYAGSEHRDEWLVPSEEVRGKWMTPIELDGGERARAALNSEEGQP